jgi:hypothetical protein
MLRSGHFHSFLGIANHEVILHVLRMILIDFADKLRGAWWPTSLTHVQIISLVLF